MGKRNHCSDQDRSQRLRPPWITTVSVGSGRQGNIRRQCTSCTSLRGKLFKCLYPTFNWSSHFPSQLSFHTSDWWEISVQRNLYISLQEYRQNKPQSSTYPHVLHCLDTIRRETMCTADDNLRWVPPNGLQGLRPGDRQKRQCRDWPKLQQFVQDHDACYKYVCPGDDTISNLHRFKYCPNDSQYLPAIREHFGYNETWTPWPYYDDHICGI